MMKLAVLDLVLHNVPSTRNSTHLILLSSEAKSQIGLPYKLYLPYFVIDEASQGTCLVGYIHPDWEHRHAPNNHLASPSSETADDDQSGQ